MRPPTTLTKEYQRILGRLEAAKSAFESTREAALEHQQQVENIELYRWQLASIEYSARLFEPEWDPPTRPIRAKTESVGKKPPGTIIRETLRVLGTSVTPMTARELALAIGPILIIDRDLTPDEINQVASAITNSLVGRREGFITITSDKPRKFSLSRR